MGQIESLIKELGLENRIFMLKGLKERGKSAAELRRELKNIGMEKPFSTIVRYMKNLEKMHLVCESIDVYHLTLKGRVVLNWLNTLEHKLGGFENVEEALSKYPIDYLSDEFLNDVSVLSSAELINDPFNVMFDTIKAVNDAAKEIKIVNKDIINREFGELGVNRCVSGLKLLSVVDSSTVKERIEMLYDIIKTQNIKGEKLNALKKNFVVRSLGGVSLNLIVADEKGAGISLPNPKGTNSLIPAFKSDDKEFVKWVGKIFSWHWERGEEVKW